MIVMNRRNRHAKETIRLESVLAPLMTGWTVGDPVHRFSHQHKALTSSRIPIRGMWQLSLLLLSLSLRALSHRTLTEVTMDLPSVVGEPAVAVSHPCQGSSIFCWSHLTAVAQD